MQTYAKWRQFAKVKKLVTLSSVPQQLMNLLYHFINPVKTVKCFFDNIQDIGI